MLFGAAGFTFTSLAGFAVWVLWGRWFYRNVGEAGLYLACLIVFLLFAGLLLHPLIGSGSRVKQLYKTFIPAFVAYAVVWSAAWFWQKNPKGEWVGSLLGSVVFALVLKKMLRSSNRILPIILVLFLTHSAGYFAGRYSMGWLHKPRPLLEGFTRAERGKLGMWSWGLFYGLGFGLGIGYAYAALQGQTATSVRPEEEENPPA
jgi:hypothetical protein